jgi:hypothetical protein
VRVSQPYQGFDLSDHYGIRCRLTQVVQHLPAPLPQGRSVTIKPIRFRCLNTTDGPGDDELEFTIRFASANGQERSVTSKRYEDIDQGTEARFDLLPLQLTDPEEFLMIVANAKEIDTLSANDDLGTTQVTLDWRALARLASTSTRIALPRLTGDGCEYVIEVEVAVT